MVVSAEAGVEGGIVMVSSAEVEIDKAVDSVTRSSSPVSMAVADIGVVSAVGGAANVLISVGLFVSPLTVDEDDSVSTSREDTTTLSGLG